MVGTEQGNFLKFDLSRLLEIAISDSFKDLFLVVHLATSNW